MLLFGAYTLAQSQQPSPGRRETSQEQQRASDSKPQNAESTGNSTATATEQIRADAADQGDAQTSEDWRMVLFTGILTLVAVFQLIAMIVQSKFMRDGLAETKESIAEATRSAKAMEDIAGAMRESVDSVKSSIAISREIAETNARIADNAAASFKIEQRAKLNVAHIQFDNFGPGHFPTVVVQFQNTGQSPAALQGMFTCVLTEIGLPQQRDDDPFVPRSGVVAPGRTVTVTIRPEPTSPAFTEEEWSRIVSGEYSLCVYGAMQYDAGMGIAGEAGFGFEFNPKLTRLPLHQRLATTPIPGYNYSN